MSTVNNMATKPTDPDLIDPVVHSLNLTPRQWVKTILVGIVILPLRMCIMFLSLIGGWIAGSLAVWDLSDEQLDDKPLLGRRAKLKEYARWFGKLTFRSCGLSITVKGRRAMPSQAPILVVAPHSTFWDAFAIFWAGKHIPYMVSRAENKKLPFVRTGAKCAQVLFVSREDPNSRHKTKEEIVRRANNSSREDWPQLLIFPEGSTSNRQALMTFKPGAFFPGKAVQPVILRYTSKIDTVTWTWNQPHSAITVFWLTLCQMRTRAEMEFLPVYDPSDAEIEDPKLFARNVRYVMAAALGVPTSDVTYEDVKKRYGKKED
jgi:lysophosphatidylcholine acyltransferase/lyso-PAF acetyltransferase